MKNFQYYTLKIVYTDVIKTLNAIYPHITNTIVFVIIVVIIKCRIKWSNYVTS